MLLDSNKLNNLSLLNIKTLQDNKTQILGGVMSRKILLENLIENGDFRNGTEGWNRPGIPYDLSIEDNMLKVTYKSKLNNNYVENNTINYTSDIYYAVTKYFTKQPVESVRHYYNGSYRRPWIEYPAVDEVITLSNRFVGNPSGFKETQIRLINSASVAGDVIYIISTQLINLTQSFGAGNEPTKEQMDKIIDTLGYFETQEIYWGELI